MGEKQVTIHERVNSILDECRRAGIAAAIVWTENMGFTVEISTNAVAHDALKMLECVAGGIRSQIEQPLKSEEALVN